MSEDQNAAISLDERLTELEIKFAYSLETIETLNNEVTKQWAMIDKLTRQLDLMRDQVVNLAAEMGNPQDEAPPPHY